jgi:HK97 family phage portal protein
MANFSANIKSLLRDGIKAASGMFASGGSTSSGLGYGGSNIGGFGSGISGLFKPFPGSQINWSLVTGGIHDNPVAFTCLSIIQDNFVQAKIRIEMKSEDEEKYEPVPDHPLLPILQQPNPYYSWDYLVKGVIASMHGQNDGYIGIERDTSTGLPVELYWLPTGVRPDKKAGSKRLIDGWIFRVGDKEYPIPLRDIIHIPMGCNPARPGFGLSGWNALKQDQYILQQTGNFTANIMRNNGAMGVLLSPKMVKDANGNVTSVKAEPKTIVDMWRAKTQGDKVGDAMYLDFPMDVTFPKNSPQDLALDTLPDRSECNICAVFRVSLLLVGAYAGRGAKTYNNLVEARQALWEENLLPLSSVIAAELTTQLLPQLGGDMTNERIGFDTSQVRALQPDLDKLHQRARQDFMANCIDLYTYMKETHRIPEEWQKGVYRWMLPNITDRATSIDSLVPPGGKQQAAIIPVAKNGNGKELVKP